MGPSIAGPTDPKEEELGLGREEAVQEAQEAPEEEAGLSAAAATRPRLAGS